VPLASSAALVALLAQAAPAWGHAVLVYPPSRNVNDSSIKTGPCGNYAPGSGERTTLVAGSRIFIQFDETINHPGYFQLFFSPVADTQFTLVEDAIPHRNDNPARPTFANPRHYAHEITVPTTPCAGCTLQFIQVMEDRNPPTLYFSCADIEIVAPTPDAGFAPDADPAPDAAPPDLGVPDAGFAPDAAPAPDAVVAPDAPEPLDAGSPLDAAPGRDAETAEAPMRGAQPTGGCQAAPASPLAALALVAAIARRRRR
jgi:Synergist-CTERM protein sorting domain-containing protein